MKRVLTSFAVAAMLACSAASATVLTASLQADDEFFAYISTSDSVDGALFLSGLDWQDLHTGAITLAQGTDYYLHIVVRDFGGLAGLLGEFSLSDSTHRFDNGDQTLLTGIDFWQGSTTGFGANDGSLVDFGQNGSAGWDFQPGVSPDAHWIWAGSPGVGNTAYFSTRIGAIAEAPEPGSFALLALGLAGCMAFVRRKA